MTARRTLLILMTGILFTILLSGCLEQVSTKNSIINEPSVCSQQIHPNNEIFTVLRGEPFTYTGVVPCQGIQFVIIEVSSPFYKPPYISESVPVNDDGTFIFSLNRSMTRYLGEAPLIEEDNAPYRVSLNFTATGKHFTLNIVQTPADLQCAQDKKWFSTNPFSPVQVSAEFRNVTRDLIVNGTTNLTVGEEIGVIIRSTSNGPCQMYKPTKNYISRCGDYLEETVQVQNGSCGINTWSFTVNTSYYRFSDPEYVLFVHSANKSRNCSAWDTTFFRLEPDNPQYRDSNGLRVVDTYGPRK